MNDPVNIGVFYSHGPHFMRVLRTVRAQHPGARVVAFVPAGFPVDLAGAAADAVVIVPAPPHSPRRPGVLLALIRQIRAARLDRFVVMFDSTRLRLVARASGAGERWCMGPDGAYRPLAAAGTGTLAQTLMRRVRGSILFLRIWWAVRTTRVGPH